MYATDFTYNGKSLSEYGLTICNFDGASGIEEVQAGMPLTFKTVSRNKGRIHSLVDLVYDSYLEVTFDICKDSCIPENTDDMKISDELYLRICKWLLQKRFHQLTFIDDNHSITRHYDGSFNASKLMFDDVLYGLRLTFTSNRPFAYGDDVTVTHSFSGGDNWSYTNSLVLCDHVRPYMVIECNEDGDLIISNLTTESVMRLNNCENGEIITIDGENMIIRSSNSEHKVWSDFNYEFVTLNCTNESNVNIINSSISCDVAMTYKPIIRDMP